MSPDNRESQHQKFGINSEKPDVYEWQEKRIKERLKKADKGGKFFSGDQVDKIVNSFKP